MPELKYPIELTPNHWAKKKGLLAKAKPTGVGEALGKLSKAHDDLDQDLFDTDKLKTLDAVEKAINIYEDQGKKKFIKAFNEAKTVEDVATTAAAALKKAALPKSAVDAAAEVSTAASEYAAALTSFRQTGVAALEKLRTTLAKQEDDDEDDDNAPANVIAARVAKKVVTALKLVKANQGDTDAPVQRFVAGVGKTRCALFVGATAGSPQKILLKKMLADDGSTIKFYVGTCIWEKEVHTFVGDDIPLGGFAKRLQTALFEATTRKLKIRVRRPDGEAEEVDAEDAPVIPEAPSQKPDTKPPVDEQAKAERELTQRLKFLAPRLKRLVAQPPPTGTIATKAKDDLGLKVAAKEFSAALEIVAKLESLADKLGLAATETRAPIDPRDELKKENLLKKVETLLWQSKVLADNIAGSPTPTYKTKFLDQYKALLAEKEKLALETATGIVKKKLPNLTRRCELLKTRLDTAAVDGPDAVSNLETWGTQRLATLENSVKAPLGTDAKRLAVAPMVKMIKDKIALAQSFIDRGEFSKANELSGSCYHLVTGAQTALANYDRDFPNYEVERNKAVEAIKQLKKHKQAPAVSAEIARIESELERIDGVATSDDGWNKARQAVALIVTQCAEVTGLANRIEAQKGKLTGLTLKCSKEGGDLALATRRAGFALKLVAEEGCSDDEAVQMAADVDEYMTGGLSERDALVSARVCKALKDAQIPEAKAKLVGKVMRAGGSSTADDAKAVATGLARLSVEALENLLANGIPTECFRGGVTEVDPTSIGVIPRGWELTGKTWDHVPGMYSAGQGKVLVGTMDDGGDRKVPGKGEVAGLVDGVEISHGTDDLIGHEAGHAFDVSDGDVKNKNALFRAARSRDIAAGNLVKRAIPTPPVTTPPTVKPQPADTATGMFVTRDDYFVVQSEGGVEETHASSGSQGDLDAACSEAFAESFAMHFAGKSRWPELEKFWEDNPWGV